MALHEPRLQTPEHPVPLAGIYKVIKRFNRNTTWVATGLLGSVIFAALMVALQERHPEADDLTEEPGKTRGDLSLNADPAWPPRNAGGLPPRNTGGRPPQKREDCASKSGRGQSVFSGLS